MELPNYMTIICDLSGNVLQSDAEICVKKIFELIHNDSKEQFFSFIKKVTLEREFVKFTSIKLVNNDDYYIDIDLLNDKMCFYLQKVDEKSCRGKFFDHIDTKFKFCMDRQMSLLDSISELISDIFYKSRNDIMDIINALCTALRIQYGLVLFHNGRDHALYCADTCTKEYLFERIEDSKSDLKFEDKKIEENIIQKITDKLYVKMSKDSYFNVFKPEICDCNRKIYVLKLVFSTKTIGYLEIIPHTFINLTPVELKVLESLSCILAYIIYNKNEELEITNYIKQKFDNV